MKFFRLRVLFGCLCCLFLGLHSAQAKEVAQLQKLLASDGAAYDYMGYSVAISGDLAIVGAWGKIPRRERPTSLLKIRAEPTTGAR